MASKASTIIHIDLETDRVTYLPFGRSTNRVDRFHYLAKIDRIRVLKAMGVSFEKSPMHRNDIQLNGDYAAQKTFLMDKGTLSIDVTAPEEKPDMPTKTTTKETTDGGLDAVLRTIVKDVIGDYVPEVPAEDIVNKVNEAMGKYQTLFDATIEEVVSLKDIVKTMQPRITEVKLPNGEIRKLDGVQHSQFNKVLLNLQMRVPTYLVGPAGTGKSTIAENASQALGLDFYSKSCSSQATESSLLGYMSATGQYVGTGFRTAFEHGGVYLLDEVDNGNANVLTVLNSALANTFMAFPDGMVKRHENFVLVATANTFGHGATAEYVGRNPLDAAFLDRFASVVIGYDNDIEQAMLNAVGLEPTLSAKWLNVVRVARQNAENYGLRVVVSPRATVHGARLLKGDAYSIKEVVDATILKGAKPEIAEKVMMGVAL